MNTRAATVEVRIVEEAEWTGLEAAQRAFSERSAPLRDRLTAVVQRLPLPR